MISYQTDGVEMPAIKKSQTTEWIKAVAATYKKRVGEIAYIFCSDEKILEVNRQYLQHDYYTDIITFDYCEGNRSVEIYLSASTRYVQMQSSSAVTMKRSYTGLLSTVFCIFAVLMIKDRENGRLWRQQRIKRWLCDEETKGNSCLEHL